MAEKAIETTEAHSYDCYSDYAKRLMLVNQGIRFTDVRGKAYAEVNQRVLAFWALFPEGRIETEIVGDNGQRCDVVCRVYRNATDAIPAVTGHAFEDRNTNINKTSYVENCETSAIGRALGFLGIGATNAIASADEVLNAIAQQEATKADPTGRNGQGGTSTQQRGKSPQNRQTDPRKKTFATIANLKMQAMELGAPESDINAWFSSKFGDVGMNRLTDEQLQEVTHFLGVLIETCRAEKEADQGKVES